MSKFMHIVGLGLARIDRTRLCPIPSNFALHRLTLSSSNVAVQTTASHQVKPCSFGRGRRPGLFYLFFSQIR